MTTLDAQTYDNSPTGPSTYDSGTTSNASAIKERLDIDYVRSIGGILKIVQIVLSLITFICATANPGFVWYFGGGWVQFVAMTTFLINIILFIFYMFSLLVKLPPLLPFALVEFVYYIVATTFFFISAIVASVVGWRHSAITATAVFSWFTLAAYGADIYFKFTVWRSGGPTLTQQSPPSSTPGNASGGGMGGGQTEKTRAEQNTYNMPPPIRNGVLEFQPPPYDTAMGSDRFAEGPKY